MATVYNALIRKIRSQDLKDAEFDENGDVIVETISTVEGDKDGTAILAYDIPVSKTLFINPEFDLSAGDNIEDAFLNLRALIDSYTYTLPTLYDTTIIGSTDTTDYIGVSANSTQNYINKYFYDLITAIEIPTVPEYDNQIKLISSTYISLGLDVSDNVSTALISLKNEINSLSNPYDSGITISTTTLDSITGFTGTTQSDMNIFLNDKIGEVSGVWEQVESSAYITPTVLSGQTLTSGVILEKNRPLCLAGSDTGSRIVSGTNYDDVTIYGNTNAVISAGLNPDGYFTSATVGSNNYGLNFNQLDNVTELDISTDYQKLYLKRDSDSTEYEASLYFDDGYGLNMKKTGSVFSNTTNLINYTDQKIYMNYNSSTGVRTTKLSSSENTYLYLGGTYNYVNLQRSSTNYLKMTSGSPGVAPSTKLAFDDTTYINMIDDEIIISANTDTSKAIIVDSDKIKLQTATDGYITVDDDIITIYNNETKFQGTTTSSLVTVDDVNVDIDVPVYCNIGGSSSGGIFMTSSGSDGIIDVVDITVESGNIHIVDDYIGFGQSQIRMSGLTTTVPTTAGELYLEDDGSGNYNLKVKG